MSKAPLYSRKVSLCSPQMPSPPKAEVTEMFLCSDTLFLARKAEFRKICTNTRTKRGSTCEQEKKPTKFLPSQYEPINQWGMSHRVT